MDFSSDNAKYRAVEFYLSIPPKSGDPVRKINGVWCLVTNKRDATHTYLGDGEAIIRTESKSE